MASFVRPFNPSSVARVSPDLVVRLPDPARVSGDPLVRNGVARWLCCKWRLPGHRLCFPRR